MIIFFQEDYFTLFRYICKFFSGDSEKFPEMWYKKDIACYHIFRFGKPENRKKYSSVFGGEKRHMKQFFTKRLSGFPGILPSVLLTSELLIFRTPIRL